MPLDEFQLWVEYSQSYPIDGTREDYRSAIIAAACAAPWGGSADAEDYIPHFGYKSAELKQAESIAYFTMLAAQDARQNTK
jgi:hypothetical protein